VVQLSLSLANLHTPAVCKGGRSEVTANHGWRSMIRHFLVSIINEIIVVMQAAPRISSPLRHHGRIFKLRRKSTARSTTDTGKIPRCLCAHIDGTETGVRDFLYMLHILFAGASGGFGPEDKNVEDKLHRWLDAKHRSGFTS
jgi:hypothetical protein